MASINLQYKIATEFKGSNDGVSAKFTVNDTDFVFTDGTITSMLTVNCVVDLRR